MKISKQLKTKILIEIGRLSKIIHDDQEIGLIDRGNISFFAYVINRLAGILNGIYTIDEFHEGIVNASEKIRQFYYELLFEEK